MQTFTVSKSKYKHFLSFLFVFLSTALQAQITFEKVIDTLGVGVGVCIQPTFDGGYVVCGNNINSDVTVLKLDSIGTIVWGKTMINPGIDGPAYIEQTLDTGYLVNAGCDQGGSNGKHWLIQLDKNGDTLWTKKLALGAGGTIPYQFNSMASLNHTLFGCIGGYRPPQSNPIPYFLATIGNGIVLSTRLYNYSYYSPDIHSIDKTYDGGFITAGCADTAPPFAHIYLIKTNNYGDTIWTRWHHLFSDNECAADVKQTLDSGYIVTGAEYDKNYFKYNLFLMKVNSLGDLIWTKVFPKPFEEVPYSIKPTTDSGFVIVGYTNTNIGRNLYLLKTTSLGDTLWTRKFSSSNLSGGLSVSQTNDNGYIITGYSTTPTGLYIIKTDSLGMVYSTTGIPEVNNPFSLNIFPNPNGGEFTLHAKGISKKGAPYKIYNANNQCVYSSDLVNNSDCSLNLSYLPNGLYFIVLYTDNKVFSRKFILEK
jgi:hypothetical protein